MLSRLVFAAALAIGTSQAIAERDRAPANEPQPELSSEPAPRCGDGVVDPGEICDDGNCVDGDGCSSTCSIDNYPPRRPECGDGSLDENEECDDGNVEDGDGCTATCDLEA